MSEPSSSARVRAEHRNTELGDRACFCTQCGWARRYYPGVIDIPTTCATCGGPIVSHCPACGEDILSIMAVECDVCEAPLRDPEVNGIRIRRAKRLPMAQPPQPPTALRKSE